MNKKISIPLIIPELFVTWIIYLVKGGDFYKTFFFVNLTLLALIILLFLGAVLFSSKKVSTTAIGGVFLLVITGLSFLLPWLISVIFKIEFFKAFLVVAVILEIAKIGKRNESSN